MKIAIFTMFNGLKESYSLVCAVKTQLKILLDNKYSVKLLVSEQCPDNERQGIFADERIEWVKISNTIYGKQFKWINYEENDTAISESFYIMRNKVTLDLERALADVDVCIAHDILYQGLHLTHNAALRIALAKFPKIRVLAFTHSQPRLSPTTNQAYPLELMYKDMPNTTFICPTEQDLLALSRQYKVDISRCKSIPTAFDYLDGMSEEVIKIFSGIPLEKPELILVYPARAVAAKAHNKLLMFAGILKRITKSDILIIFCDTGANEQFYKLIEFAAKQNGIQENEYILTSKLGFPQGISHKGVLDLFTISNVVVLPTIFETQSLLVAEAASRGNYLILNQDVPLFNDIAAQFGACLIPFGKAGLSNTKKFDYFGAGEAVVETIRNNSILKGKLAARRLYSPLKIGKLLIELFS